MKNGQPHMARSRNHQEGVAAVEAAIVLPLLVIMLLVIFDFGRVMYPGITNSNAARAAVGYGAQSTAFALDHAGMNNAARGDAQNLPINVNNAEHVDSTARHFCRCPGSTAEINCTSSSCPKAPEVYVEVTTSRVFGTIAGYPGIPTSVDLSHTAIMRVQ